MSMVKRVAMAIRDTPQWHREDPPQYAEDFARAAIAAMRDGVDLADLAQFLADNMDVGGTQPIGYWGDVAKSAVIGIFYDDDAEPVDDDWVNDGDSIEDPPISSMP